MQDRFKYRAWNIKNKIYHYDAETTYDGFGGTPVISKQTFYSLLNDDNYIVEQCTGLRDKNGKLIYEGDIVAKEFSDRPFSSKAKSKIKNCLVYWHKSGRFSIKYNNDEYRCYSAPHDSFIGDCEVIGNIHENPDLLENKDE